MENDNKTPANKGITRDDKGRYVKGVSGNPTGKNSGRKSLSKLIEAIEEAETSRDKSLWAHLVERAYKNDRVAIALFNKLIPNNVLDSEKDERDRIINIITYKKEDYDQKG
jgi:hypothetical protein